MSHHDHSSENMPFNALPPTVAALAIFVVGIELLFQVGSFGVIGGPEAVGWRVAAIQRFGFFDSVFDAMREQGSWPIEHVIRTLSYSMLHTSLVQAIMVAVFILALGKRVGETFGSFSVILVFTLSAIVGALAYGVIATTKVPLLGGYPGAYGLIGAYTFILWLGLGAVQQNQMRAFTLIGFLMGIQLIFALIGGTDLTWIADLAGFFAGFIVAIFLVPGVIPRLIARIRNRQN
jgi:membrane associated rhomboid family serine protease